MTQAMKLLSLSSKFPGPILIFTNHFSEVTEKNKSSTLVDIMIYLTILSIKYNSFVLSGKFGPHLPHISSFSKISFKIITLYIWTLSGCTHIFYSHNLHTQCEIQRHYLTGMRSVFAKRFFALPFFFSSCFLSSLLLWSSAGWREGFDE